MGNLNRLPPTGYFLMVMPIKIKDGSGAPSRILAAPKEYFMSLSAGRAFNLSWELLSLVLMMAVTKWL